LLRAVAGMEDEPLQTALERLAEADILLVQGLPPPPTIVSSTRSFTRKPRPRDNIAGTTATEPELLAYHFTQAGLNKAAIEWLGEAGQRSLARSALVEFAQEPAPGFALPRRCGAAAASFCLYFCARGARQLFHSVQPPVGFMSAFLSAAYSDAELCKKL